MPTKVLGNAEYKAIRTGGVTRLITRTLQSGLQTPTGFGCVFGLWLCLSSDVNATPVLYVDAPEFVDVGQMFDVTMRVSGVNNINDFPPPMPPFTYPLRSWNVTLVWSTGVIPSNPQFSDGYFEGDFGGVGGNTPLVANYQPGATPSWLGLSQGSQASDTALNSQVNDFNLVSVHFLATVGNVRSEFMQKMT